MEEKLLEIAARIKELREILGITPEEMAGITGVKKEEYLIYEEGRKDFPFTFLYNSAKRFGVDISELLTGESPRLSLFNLVRKGEGLRISRRKGFSYQNLAYLFKNRMAEPYIVDAVYREDEQLSPISLNMHEGQEFDIVLKGSLKMQIDDHEFYLNEGDSVYYNSSHPHGMIAANGKDCKFLAIVIGKTHDKSEGNG